MWGTAPSYFYNFLIRVFSFSRLKLRTWISAYAPWKFNNNWHKYSMKPSSFGIIELLETIILPEAHAMNKSITQATQNDKQVSKSIKRFFTRFHISSALKASNAYKKKGIPVTEIFQYLFLLIFSNRSMYMNLITGRNTPAFAKDTVYRFMKMIQINCIITLVQCFCFFILQMI